MANVAQKTATRTTEPPPSEKRAKRRVDPEQIAADMLDDERDLKLVRVLPEHAAGVVSESIAEIGVAVMALHRVETPNADDLASMLFNVRDRLRGVHAAMPMLRERSSSAPKAVEAPPPAPAAETHTANVRHNLDQLVGIIERGMPLVACDDSEKYLGNATEIVGCAMVELSRIDRVLAGQAAPTTTRAMRDVTAAVFDDTERRLHELYRAISVIADVGGGEQVEGLDTAIVQALRVVAQFAIDLEELKGTVAA